MLRNKKKLNHKSRKGSKALSWYRLILGAYLFVIALLTLTPFSWQRSIFPGITTVEWDHTHNLIPFFTILTMIQTGDLNFAVQQILGNIALFMPVGFLLPLAFKYFSNWKKILAAGFSFTLLIEVSQFLLSITPEGGFRIFDVDDLILNAAGVALGYALLKMVMSRKNSTKDAERRIILVLPDIRSLHNVGSLFRTGDAFGVEKVYLCGITGTPESPSAKNLTKVSLGAETYIPWEYRKNAVSVVRKLKKEGWQVISLEQSENSLNPVQLKLTKKVVLVVGNEVEGVNKKILKLSDHILEIPMQGQKESLNVSVAGGIALYILRNKQ